MSRVTRLVTHADLDENATGVRQIAVTARLEAELADGRRVLLLDGRGWSSFGPADMRARTSAEDIRDTARTVVGPDEPSDNTTHEQMAADHWGTLADTLRRQGVDVGKGKLAELRHDVLLGESLRAWIAPS